MLRGTVGDRINQGCRVGSRVACNLLSEKKLFLLSLSLSLFSVRWKTGLSVKRKTQLIDIDVWIGVTELFISCSSRDPTCQAMIKLELIGKLKLAIEFIVFILNRQMNFIPASAVNN